MRKFRNGQKSWMFGLMMPLALAIVSELPMLLIEQSWGVNTAKVLAQESSEARLEEADQLLELGIQQFNSGQTQAALETFQRERDLWQQMGDREGERRSLGWIG